MNHEGYSDPTADQAVREASRQPDRVTELIYLMKRLAELTGYEVTNRIHVRDTKTGREYR